MHRVVCDACGAEQGAAEGWFEVATWGEPVRHACSPGCLRDLGESLEAERPREGPARPGSRR